MEKGLDYVFDKETKLIILGTFPSKKSRNKCYYNNPQNQFWKIIADIFNAEEVISGNSTERYACLLKNGVGLWDVIKTCHIQGSSDSSITKQEYNDFSIIKQNCPKIKYIVFNSHNAKKLFDKYIKQEKNEDLKNWLLKLTNNGNNMEELYFISSCLTKSLFKTQNIFLPLTVFSYSIKENKQRNEK